MLLSSSSSQFVRKMPTEDAIGLMADAGFDAIDFSFEAGNFINGMPRELCLAGARLMVETGRYLIDRIEK